MITLEYPLSLLALASIPVLLILFNLRPKRTVVRISSNTLWREALRERDRGLGLQRLLRNLSLALLLAFALMLAFGVSDPLWVAQVSAQDDTIVVLDTSASMNALSGNGTRFDEAKARVGALIDELADSSRLLLMTSAREPRLVSAFESDRSKLRAVLASLSATEESGRAQDALSLALSLLKDRERGRVVFATDGAFDHALDGGLGANVEWMQVGGNVENIAITRFDVRAEIDTERRFQVLLSVRNYTSSARSVPVVIVLNRRELLREVVTIEPEDTNTIVRAFEGTPRGRIHAEIEVDDALEADDAAYALAHGDEHLRVLLISSENYFLQSALSALPNVEVELQTELEPEALAELVRRNDVVVIDGIEVGDLPRGRYVLFDSLPTGLPFETKGVLTSPSLTSSGLLSGVDVGGVALNSAKRINREPENVEVQPLLLSGDTPVALALAQRDRRLIYFGFDIRASNLPYRAAFPLMLKRSVEWLKPRQSRFARTQISAGERYRLGVAHGAKELVVRTPDGEGLTIEAHGEEVLFEETQATGFYRFSTDVGHVDLAVNLTDAAESDVRPRAAIPAPPSGVDNNAASARASTQLWPYLTALALMLLMFEWVVQKRRLPDA